MVQVIFVLSAASDDKEGRRFFQNRAVLQSRGAKPKSKVLCLPVSRADETSKAGTGIIVEEFLHLGGFISSPASSVESGSRGRLSKNVRLTNPADLSNHWMVFVGDGLSQRRFDEYSADLHSEQPSFCAHYEQLHVMRRALSQSVFVTGDLHGGRFHTLKPAYNLFYGVFIQPIQVGLGWKRIDAGKVENAYMQASLLALKLLTECERQAYDAFVHSVCRATMLVLSTTLAPELSMKLAVMFLTWMEDCLANSRDEVFRMALHYVKVV